MRVFIGQSMANKRQGDIIAERKSMEEAIKKRHPDEEIEFIDSLLFGKIYNLNPVNAALFDLGESLEFLAEADLAVFKKSTGSRGCKIEKECCKLYGIPLEELD